MGDAQGFLMEDIFVYSTLLFIDASLDFWVNLFYATGLMSDPHPYHYGFGQIVFAVACAIQLARKVLAFRYYAK